ncbi:hypothetical protein PS684_02668 [Pseudomonas fluorescens]|nr:hypothetical protein PS681_03268 [Pseudomonas fluorescens]VVN57106.1 hypothetical protein PS684_02668 [Pseudomonas fluorescens]
MIDLSVVFKVPEWLAAGLQSGELERVGGVIRDKVTKKVVAWLREGDSVSTEPPSEVLNGQFSKLMMQGQVLMGLQVANLVVSAVGFAMIYRKLQGIERQLSVIGDAVNDVKAKQEWLEDKDWMAKFAPVKAAMSTLADLQHYVSPKLVHDKLFTAETQCSVAQNYFHDVIRKLTSDNKEYLRAFELSMSYRSWLASGQGRIQALSELGEQKAALTVAKNLTADHAEFGKTLTAILSDPLRRFVPGNYDQQASASVIGLANQATQVHQVLKGNVLQLDFMHENKLRPSDLPSAEELDQQGMLIYLANR